MTKLTLKKATNSSGVLQSLLGALHYSCFVYVVLLGTLVYRIKCVR